MANALFFTRRKRRTVTARERSRMAAGGRDRRGKPKDFFRSE